MTDAQANAVIATLQRIEEHLALIARAVGSIAHAQGADAARRPTR
jgi:hypothetical protein